MFNKTSVDELADKRVYLFGAGKIGKATLDEFGINKIFGVLDNIKTEMTYKCQKIQVQKPSDIRLSDDSVIIVAALEYEKIVEQLKQLGWNSEQIYISVSWKIPFEDDPEKTGYDGVEFSEHSTRELLEDEYSRTLFDFILENRGGKVNIYSYDQLSEINNKGDYWEEIMLPQIQECAVLDCGAFQGDSIETIVNAIMPQKCTYYAFEPDANVHEALREVEESVMKEHQNVHFVNIPKGVWLKSAELTFNYHSEDAATTLSDNKNLSHGETGKVEVMAIDELDILEDTVFTKMDAEGSEAAALKGAERLISEKKPFLAISAYHRPSDIFMLPALIKHINPDYKIFLRGGLHYTIYAI